MWGKGWQHPLSGKAEGQEIVAILELVPLFRRLGEGGGLRDVVVGSGTEGQRDRGMLAPGCVPRRGAVSPHASSTAEAQQRRARICSLSLVTLPAWECSG